MSDRKGSDHELGRERLRQLAGPDAEEAVARITAYMPELGDWIRDFVFAEVFGRDGLDLRTRQIVNVSALCALGTATPQLEIHMNGALNAGVSEDELKEIVLQLAVYAGFPAALNGMATLERVVKARAERGTAAPEQPLQG